MYIEITLYMHAHKHTLEKESTLLSVQKDLCTKNKKGSRNEILLNF